MLNSPKLQYIPLSQVHWSVLVLYIDLVWFSVTGSQHLQVVLLDWLSFQLPLTVCLSCPVEPAIYRGSYMINHNKS